MTFCWLIQLISPTICKSKIVTFCRKWSTYVFKINWSKSESNDSPNMRVWDSFLPHHLPKTKEKNYSDSRNLDCPNKSIRTNEIIWSVWQGSLTALSRFYSAQSGSVFLALVDAKKGSSLCSCQLRVIFLQRIHSWLVVLLWFVPFRS